MTSRINSSHELSDRPKKDSDISDRAAEASADLQSASVLPPQPSQSFDSVRAYLKEIGRVPMLSREEELTEARKVQRYMQLLVTQGTENLSEEDERVIEEGLKAKAHMIQANLRLVVSVAKKYANRGLELMDLIQEGNLGLERGVEKFDPSKGYRFSTYSYWWIRQSITRATHNQGRVIRLPVHITEKLNALKKAQREISQEKGRTATVVELAAATESSPEDVRKLLSQARQPLSLDIKVGQEQDTELGDLIESEGQSPEDEAMRTMLQDTLDMLLTGLNGREQEVMELRYGIKGGQAKSLAEIGEVLSLSRERVRQIEAKALRKLRAIAAKEQIQDYLSNFG